MLKSCYQQDKYKPHTIYENGITLYFIKLYNTTQYQTLYIYVIVYCKSLSFFNICWIMKMISTVSQNYYVHGKNKKLKDKKQYRNCCRCCWFHLRILLCTAFRNPHQRHCIWSSWRCIMTRVADIFIIIITPKH